MPKIVLANPRGFCAGVDRAIEIVEEALAQFGAPVYVRHEIVHNRRVVDGLRTKGAVFVDEVAEIPEGATAIFSAHGVAQSVHEAAAERGLNVFDATCPLVTKVHMEVRRHARAGREVVLIGHDGHPEVDGTLGQYLGERAAEGGIYLVQDIAEAEHLEVKDPEDLAFVTQTTLSVDDTLGIIEALRRRFPAIEGPRKDDICYATQNRQDAVKELVRSVDVLIVVGSANSSNSQRLREIAERAGCPAYLVDAAEALEPDWIADCEAIGVTAGASAPEATVADVVERLQGWGAEPPEERPGREETVTFRLPRELARRATTPS